MNFGFEYGVVDIGGYLRHRPLKGRDWIKSILVFVFPYAGKAPEVDGYLTAKYAYGKDYHAVIKQTGRNRPKLGLKKYERACGRELPGRKTLRGSRRLGKIGKQLAPDPEIRFPGPDRGIRTDADFPKTEKVVPDPASAAFLCVRKCRTGALRNGFDKKRCLSYLSQKAGGDFELYEKMELVVGCDVCQDVCPLNRQEQAFPEEFRFDWKSRFTLEEFLEIGKEAFKEHYKDKAFCFLATRDFEESFGPGANKNSLLWLI